MNVGKFGRKGGTTMSRIRKLIAIAACGVMIGALMSVFAAAPATGKAYARCDKKIETMEKQAAKDYARGKLSADEYANVMAEIAYHRELWGC